MQRESPGKSVALFHAIAHRSNLSTSAIACYHGHRYPLVDTGYLEEELLGPPVFMSDRARRYQLFNLLASLPPAQFEGLLFALNISAGNVSANSAAQSYRVGELLQWAESPIGCGLAEVAASLQAMGVKVPDFTLEQPPIPSRPSAEDIASKAPHPQKSVNSVASTKSLPAQDLKASTVNALTNQPPFPSVPQRSTAPLNQPFPTDVSAAAFQEDLGNGVSLDVIYIPGGTFWMGSPDKERDRRECESPQHKVQIPSFYMGEYTITQKQWYAVSFLDRVKRELKPHPSRFTGDNLPVETVSWDDAVEFCDRLSRLTGKTYRLPSEAEWEYACRANTMTPYFFGETLNSQQANFGDRQRVVNEGFLGIGREEQDIGIEPVGSYPANVFGLRDMHGNVWEWCQDTWHPDYRGAPADGAPWIAGGVQKDKVSRGGSWVSFPKSCRSAHRNYFASGNRYDSIGFRVMCSASKTV